MNFIKKIRNFFMILLLLIIFYSLKSYDVYAEGKIKVGDYVQFGSYYNEPIIWRVINIDEDGNQLIFADKIIAFKVYDAAGTYHQNGYRAEEGSNYWKDSNIRQWLNSDEKVINWIQNDPSMENPDANYDETRLLKPYDKEKGFLAEGNFTLLEKSAIKPVTHRVYISRLDRLKGDGGKEKLKFHIDSQKILNYDTAYYENVKDNVFFLDIDEIKKYIDARGWSRVADCTSSALANDIYGENSELIHDYCAYLTRSIFDICDVWSIPNYGGIHAVVADSQIVGIRPALYLDSSNLGIYSGSGSNKSPYVVSGKEEKKK